MVEKPQERHTHSTVAVDFGHCYLAAAERGIDPGQSKITIHVGKTGLFAAAVYEHDVSALVAEGAIDDSETGHVSLRIEAGGFPSLLLLSFR